MATLPYILLVSKHHCPTASNSYLDPSWTQGLQWRQASDALPHASGSFSPVQFPLGAGCDFCWLAPQAQLPEKLLLDPSPGVGSLDVATSPPLEIRSTVSPLDTFPHGPGPKPLGWTDQDTPIIV